LKELFGADGDADAALLHPFAEIAVDSHLGQRVSSLIIFPLSIKKSKNSLRPPRMTKESTAEYAETAELFPGKDKNTNHSMNMDSSLPFGVLGD
jgi:hypothetical protein